MVFTALVASGCGAPTVDLPPGNDQITSDAAPTELPTPTVQPVPQRYPYAKIAIRGFASNASRVIVEGAGNPASGGVQPIDSSFCVDVDLAVAPAHYTLELRSQSGDGRLSGKATVELDRANDAPAPADAKLCDGTPAGG
jgi:hypothetical protein